MKKPVYMLNLEEALAEDRSGKVREKLLADFCQLQLRLQGDLRRLNDRQTYKELQGALQAVTAAIQVIATLKTHSV